MKKMKWLWIASVVASPVLPSVLALYAAKKYAKDMPRVGDALSRGNVSTLKHGANVIPFPTHRLSD